MILSIKRQNTRRQKVYSSALRYQVTRNIILEIIVCVITIEGDELIPIELLKIF